MPDIDVEARLEALEIRIAHYEAVIDELTRTLLEQERVVRDQAETLKRLEIQLRAATPSLVATRDEETPPPHY